MNRSILIALTAALFLASCDNGEPSIPPDASVKPAGPDAALACQEGESLCGTACCPAGQECKDVNTGTCCTKVDCDALGRECGDNGCGTPCGICGTGATCNTTTWKCESCTPETDAEFCTRLNRVCGAATGTDNCNSPRTVASCGVCTNNKTCEEALGTCTGACVPEVREAFCLRNGKDCGSFKAKDNCDADRTENCGLCQTGQDCLDNVCVGCIPETNDAFCTRMAGLGKVCGIVNDLDRCGSNKSVDCGLAACATGQICTSENKCQDCTPETDTELCQDAKRECGALTVNDKCGKPRTVASCGACTAGKTCTNDGTCLNSGLPEDTCGGAKALTFTGDEAKVSGDANTATADYQSSCGAVVDGKDVVYSFTITSAKSVTATLAVTTGAMVPVVYVRSVCTSGAVADEKACQKGTNTGGAKVFMPNLAAGTYYVIVDGNTTTGSEYALTVSVGAPFIAPTNDVCGAAGAAATPLVFTGDLAAAQGDTTAAANDYAGTCTGSAGGDVVYSFTLTAEKSVTASVARDASTATYKPVVYLRSVCDSAAPADQKACAADVTGTATATAKSLSAGTYYVVVDGDGSYGKYDLQVQLADPIQVPVNDVCAGAKALTFTADKATEQGDTTNANNDTKGTCETTAKPMSGTDLVYSFTTPTERSAVVTLTADASSAGFKPAVYVRSACDSVLPADQKACALAPSSGATTVTVYKVAPNTPYYVFVDGESATAGKFTLEVTLGNPISFPDNCGSAEPLVLDSNGHVTVTGDTSTATHDAAGTCKSSVVAKDFVYSLTLTSEKDVTVAHKFSGTTNWPAVFVQKVCGSTVATDELGCTALSSGTSPAVVKLKHVPPGTYYVWVDAAYAGDSGPFTLDVTAVDSLPIPTNDTCAAPALLTFNNNVATATGETGGATDDYKGLCTTATGAGDVVYTFTTTAAQMVTATVSADATTPGYTPVVYIRKTCTSSTSADQVACSVATAAGGTATAMVSDLPAGTYSVIVDGTGVDGKYNLSVTLDTARPLPDTCANAWPLTFDASGKATVSGDTTPATADVNPACDTTTGKDLVYSFTLTSEKNVLVKQTFASTSDYAAVFVQQGTCGTGTEVACTSNASSNIASGYMKRLQAGTYFVWVDSSSSYSEGAFTLEVTAADPPAVPANDSCTAPSVAQPLVFTNGVANASGDLGGAANDFVGTGKCTAGTGADMVYAVTLTAPANITAKVTPTAGSTNYAPVVYVRSSDCTATAATAQAACNTAAAGASASATAYSLPAGTHYVVVDAVSADGAFDLVVTQSAPTYFPDTCASAEPLIFDPVSRVATISADTTDAANDSAAGGDGGTCNSVTGNDLVYKMTLTAAANVKVVVTPTAGSALSPNLWIRKTTCASGSDESVGELGCIDTSSVAPVELSLTRLPAGDYWIWVDGYGGSTNGPFDMVVTLTDPPAAPANDLCAAAEPLTFTNDVATATGDTTNASDDYSASCVSSGKADVVYKFDLAAPAQVVAKVTATTTTYKPGVYIRSICTSDAAIDQLACAATTTAGGTATATAHSLPAGTHYVVVDGAGTVGAFTLDLTRSAPTSFPESCASAEPIVLDPVSGAATVTGDTTDAIDNGTGSCKSTTAKDLVYSLTLTSPKNVSAKLVFGASTYSWPMVYIRSACADSATEVACAAGTGTAAVTANAKGLPAGTYYIWVDAAYNSDDGPFTLEVTTTDAVDPPTNDTCSLPSPLTIDVTGLALASGETNSALNDFIGTGNCTGATGGDVVYSFELTAPANVTAKVTPTSASPAYKPVVYIRSNSCTSTGATDQAACAAAATAGPASATAFSLPAGTHWVVVDGAGTDGAFDLSLTTAPATIFPDECGGAETLVFDANGVATVSGDTTLASASGSGTCDTSSGLDLVYKMTITADSSATVTVTPTAGSTLHPNIYVRKACASAAAADQLGCLAYDKVASATLFVASLTPGDYWVWVDSTETTYKGGFNLKVALGAPVTALPDTCATAQPVVLDAAGKATVAGTTSSATDSGSGSCKSTTAKDLVYSLTTTSPKNIKATMTFFGSLLWPMVYIQSTCGQSASEVACGTISSSSPISATAKNLPAGTYYIWADSSYNTDSGFFTIDIETEDPPAAPLNDNCTAPEALTFTSGVATASGNTSAAVNDYTGTCGTMTGGDTVYSFTLAAPANVVTKVTPTSSGHAPGIYLRTNCTSAAAADQVACKLGTAGAATTLTSYSLAAGTYFLVVDGTGEGAYTLEVTQGAPTVFPDECANAIEMTGFDASGNGTVTVTGDTTEATNTGTSLGCSVGSGPDLAYSFTLTQPKDFSATLTFTGTQTPVIYLRNACNKPAVAADELVCKDGTTPPATITKYNLPAGQYWVWADAYSGNSGAFSLAVTLSEPPAPPTNDTCAAPEAISLDADGNGVVTVQGDTTRAQNNAAGSCKAVASNDLVYSVTVPAGKTKNVTTKLTFTETTDLANVYIRKACDSAATADEVVCVTSTTNIATAKARRLGPGTYFIWADGATAASAGPFNLEVTVVEAPPLAPNDTCAAAEPLNFVSGMATATGDTETAIEDGTGTCATANGPDMVYSFTIDAATGPQKVTAIVTPQTGSALVPVVYLRNACTDTGVNETGCASANPAIATVNSLPPGTYYVFVDGKNGTAGPFDLNVTLAAPVVGPANDLCFGATEIVIDSGTGIGTATGDNTGAINDTFGTCSGSSGVDVAFKFTTTAAHKATVTVTPDGTTPTLKPVVYVRKTCDSTATGEQLGCAYSSTAVAKSVVVNNLPPGTYYAWVDGYSSTSSSGPFTIEVKLEAPLLPPANDVCGVDGANAILLTLNNPVTGDTTLATADYDHAKVGVCSAIGFAAAGKDVVYKYTHVGTAPFTVEVTPTVGAEWDTQLWYTVGTCGNPTLCAGGADVVGSTTNGGKETLTIGTPTDGATYFFYVDNFSATGSGGGFTILVKP